MAKSNFVHHKNANCYYVRSCSSRCTLDLIALGRISLSAPSLWQFLLQQEILKDFLVVCLFVSVCSVAVEASAFIARGVECNFRMPSCGSRRKGTRRQYPRQYQTPFAPHLFTNISPTIYIFCLISFLFRGGTVLFFFWFQASSGRRIYGGIRGWACKSMFMILPAPSFIGNQCIFSSFL